MCGCGMWIHRIHGPGYDNKTVQGKNNPCLRLGDEVIFTKIINLGRGLFQYLQLKITEDIYR